MTSTNSRYSKLFMAAALLLTPLALSACNTVSGAGDDMEAAGDAISDAAEDAKN